ncbi:MAG: LPXTG cell wall anchor domain-containing protein, partial [Acidimicrobiales bacterium]|nr:LPXTG cell wall anchor domain-containing protein [Acidimicrobiales bacterium]
EGTPPPTFDPEDPTTPIPSDPVEDDDPETVPTAPAAPGIDLVKTGEAVDGNGVGDEITYTLVATNTGNVTLTGVTISDPMLGGDVTPAAVANWSSGVVGTLNPGDTVTTEVPYTLTQADIEAGSVINTAVASGTPPSGVSEIVEDDGEATVSTSAAAVPPGELPRTGASDQLVYGAMGGLVMVLLGAMFVAFTRRREEDELAES